MRRLPHLGQLVWLSSRLTQLCPPHLPSRCQGLVGNIWFGPAISSFVLCCLTHPPDRFLRSVRRVGPHRAPRRVVGLVSISPHYIIIASQRQLCHHRPQHIVQ